MTTASLRRLLLICALALGAAATVAISAGADLSSKINAKQNRAEALRAAVAAESAKIRASSAGLATAQRRLRALQADTAAQQAKLDRIETTLTQARDRLTRLVARQHQATDALRANLLAAYRNPQPDIVSVVIEAKGFTDLLEKADFLKRVGQQQARIMDGARTSRVAVTKQANTLATMQARGLKIAEALTARRDRAQALESALLQEQQRRLAGRAAKRRSSPRISKRARLAAQAPRALGAQRHRDEPRRRRAGARRRAGRRRPRHRGRQRDRRPAVPLRRRPRRLQGHGVRLLGLGQLRARRRGARQLADVVGAVHELGRRRARASGSRSTRTTATRSWSSPAGASTRRALRGGGTRWTRQMRPTGGFVARHPPGL